MTERKASKKRTLKPKTKGIPAFKNRAEEAHFWDTHSVADYWSETRPVQARFAKNLSMVLPVRFDAETLEKLRLEASKKGIGPTTLVRMLILQHLDEAPPGDVATAKRRK